MLRPTYLQSNYKYKVILSKSKYWQRHLWQSIKKSLRCKPILKMDFVHVKQPTGALNRPSISKTRLIRKPITHCFSHGQYKGRERDKEKFKGQISNSLLVDKYTQTGNSIKSWQIYSTIREIIILVINNGCARICLGVN